MSCLLKTRTVKTNYDVAQKDFDKLLNCLSDDREEAGARFEKIRGGLVRYFRLKGCHEPEALADESMNRVINRIDKLDLSQRSKFDSLFYGFASMVFLEYLRKEKKRFIQLSEIPEQASHTDGHLHEDLALDCLRKCLKDLNASDGTLLVKYYSEGNKANLKAREQLAIQNEMEIGALQTKIHRIKKVLRPCIERCLDR